MLARNGIVIDNPIIIYTILIFYAIVGIALLVVTFSHLYNYFYFKNFKGKYVSKKIDPEYFRAIVRRRKNFEIRKDEDNIQAGDLLILYEWDTDHYTGDCTGRKVKYVLRNTPESGLPEGYCIIGW